MSTEPVRPDIADRADISRLVAELRFRPAASPALSAAGYADNRRPNS